MRYSKSYDNAPMPYALWLERGLFIHAGKANGEKLSHGCIRLSSEYAKKFFDYAHIGMSVVVEDTMPTRKK